MRRIVCGLLVLAACGGSDERPEDIQFDTSAYAQPAGPAAGPDSMALDSVPEGMPADSQAGAGFGTSVLTGIRAALHDGADRIVFEFSGPLPGYKLEYIDRPVRQCGSGDVVELPGDAWLSIRFFPANAHDQTGRPSVTARDTSFTGRNLKRLKLICDFEAVVEWVAAVAHPQRYEVLELKAPERLVVDIGKTE